LDCLPTNRECKLGLDCCKIGYTRGTAHSDNWFLRLSDRAVPRRYHLLDNG
ncbi:hypothetical protein LY78DRAFT_594910, partial [Colletotrichum sublineola]